MHQKELPQVPELANGDVGASSGLEGLHAADTNTKMGRLNHGDVVGSVSDGQQERLQMPLDEFDNQCLLKWGHSAADNSLAHDGKVEEQFLHVLLQREGQC